MALLITAKNIVTTLSDDAAVTAATITTATGVYPYALRGNTTTTSTTDNLSCLCGFTLSVGLSLSLPFLFSLLTLCVYEQINMNILT